MTDLDARTTRKRVVWPWFAAGAAVLLIVMGAVILILLLGDGTGSEAAPDPTPTSAAGAPDAAAVAELQTRLASGDVNKVAEALALNPAEVTPQMLEGFSGSEIIFDLSNSEAFNGGWNIPASVTTADDSTTEWTVTVVDSDDGLIFLDSTPR